MHLEKNSRHFSKIPSWLFHKNKLYSRNNFWWYQQLHDSSSPQINILAYMFWVNVRIYPSERPNFHEELDYIIGLTLKSKIREDAQEIWHKPVSRAFLPHSKV